MGLFKLAQPRVPIQSRVEGRFRSMAAWCPARQLPARWLMGRHASVRKRTLEPDGQAFTACGALGTRPLCGRRW